jgi:UPF0755 protein
MKSRLKIIVTIFLAGFLLIGCSYYFIFVKANISAIETDFIFQVKRTTLAGEVWHECNLPLDNYSTWKMAASFKRLREIRPGRYQFKKGMSNNDIIREFRSGGQATVKLRIDNVSSLDELAGRLGESLMHDSSHFMSAFENDTILSKLTIDKNQVASIIRPDTYEFYWTMDGSSFLKKMKDESAKLWNSSRTSSCDQLGLNAHEVITLASIVKAETSNLGEAPRIAGLYLNRLRIGMPLQSDPTALFGRRKSSGRVYLNDIQSETPYNTYKFKGLPPGPINFPESTYVDAVLQAEKHRYLYMCAEPGGTGKHRFATNLGEHEQNRTAYIRWLNNQARK